MFGRKSTSSESDCLAALVADANRWQYGGQYARRLQEHRPRPPRTPEQRTPPAGS
ncbi:hypothetical protein [Kitasatospora sp. NPDC050543]|uniref:hypothetical protein n=1 Tax=Kitasatospora sp. NPDC050543 TaxID=3364054 RepID=UPI003793EE93